MLTETEFEAIKPVRYAHKVWDGRGLYLLVTPKGGRCWRFAYRFARKHKTLSLGTYPVITRSGPGRVTSSLATYSPTVGMAGLQGLSPLRETERWLVSFGKR